MQLDCIRWSPDRREPATKVMAVDVEVLGGKL